MHKFERGDYVRALDPEGTEVLIGQFLGCADADETIDIELEWASPTPVDAAWIQLDDGSTRKVVLHHLRPTYWQPADELITPTAAPSTPTPVPLR